MDVRRWALDVESAPFNLSVDGRDCVSCGCRWWFPRTFPRLLVPPVPSFVFFRPLDVPGRRMSNCCHCGCWTNVWRHIWSQLWRPNGAIIWQFPGPFACCGVVEVHSVMFCRVRTTPRNGWSLVRLGKNVGCRLPIRTPGLWFSKTLGPLVSNPQPCANKAPSCVRRGCVRHHSQTTRPTQPAFGVAHSAHGLHQPSVYKNDTTIATHAIQNGWGRPNHQSQRARFPKRRTTLDASCVSQKPSARRWHRGCTENRNRNLHGVRAKDGLVVGHPWAWSHSPGTATSVRTSLHTLSAQMRWLA